VEIVAWYGDEGVSGATLDRPEGQRMLTDAKRQTFQAVLVAKMDRIACDLRAQLESEKEQLMHEVEFVRAAGPFRGQDPSSVLGRQIIGTVCPIRPAGSRRAKTCGKKQSQIS
jgi:DNA invertase Pin-like site-specific DNA recombinase